MSAIRRMSASVVLSAFAAVSAAHAQDGGHFGANEGTTTIAAVAFRGLPAPDGSGFSNYSYPGFPGGGVSGTTGPMHLPNGAEITQLCVVANQQDFFGNVGLTLIAMEYPRAGTTTPTAMRYLASVRSGGSSGLGTWCAPLAAPVRIQSFGDIDGNGVSGWTSYVLQGSISYGPHGGVQPLLSACAFGSAIVVWRRTVSPGPAVATFTDVPTTDPRFRFVEAFVASGLATGCAPGRFCPDNGVTRGEMAVFLSTALGLHFPN